MKFSVLTTLSVCALSLCTIWTANAQENPDPKIAGYAIGQQFGSFLKDAGDLYDQEALMKGFTDALEGKESEYDEQEIQNAFMGFQRALMAKQQKCERQQRAHF